ncbi:GcrA family cell cycle regulator [Acidisoma cladoniae]|uniref:GcrA family cell cycle regulator n=1 Tax=Acidisoma cladoniae TaxID=3040935 RepID=UPI00254A8D5B|nr:GcrA family cell cycle regulator [Acidisoma sp. PAMC 29798]
MEWSDTTITELKGLWQEGHSTAEIGRRLGISKNAVVGKAHRLELSPRPSPIRRQEGGTVSPPPVPRANGPTLAPLPTRAPPAAPMHAPKPMAPPRRLAAVAAPVLRVSACCWPIGEPGKPSFHFCDAVAVHGKPYCTTHAALAYVKIRDRREDAA